MKAMFLLWLLCVTCWASPVEELGTAVDMVPKKQAVTSPFGEYGFVAIVLQQTDENNIKPTFVAHSAAEFVRLYRRLPVELQEYGIWLSLAQNDPYSAQEKTMLEELKTLCGKHRLWLFIRTGHDDRDWKRVSGPLPDVPCRQLEGQQLAGTSYERLSPIEKKLIGTWGAPAASSFHKDESGQLREIPESKEVMEITFTTDSRELWCPNGAAPLSSARWRVEGNDLVFTMEKQPNDSDLPSERKEKIARVTPTELVFTNGEVEGRWMRVR